MKRVGFLLGLLSLFALVASACAGAEGARGPAGPSGAAGAQGPAGESPSDAQISALIDEALASSIGLPAEANIHTNKGSYVIGTDTKFVTYGSGFDGGEDVLIELILHDRIVMVGGTTADEFGEWEYTPDKRFKIVAPPAKGYSFGMDPGAYMVKAQGFNGSVAYTPILFTNADGNFGS